MHFEHLEIPFRFIVDNLVFLDPFWIQFFALFGPCKPLESNCGRKYATGSLLGRKPVLHPNYKFWTLLNPVLVHNMLFCILDPFRTYYDLL